MFSTITKFIYSYRKLIWYTYLLTEKRNFKLMNISCAFTLTCHASKIILCLTFNELLSMLEFSLKDAVVLGRNIKSQDLKGKFQCRPQRTVVFSLIINNCRKLRFIFLRCFDVTFTYPLKLKNELLRIYYG